MATSKKQPKSKATGRTAAKKSKNPTKQMSNKSGCIPQTPASTSKEDRAVIQSRQRAFLIVGLGASAGGLEALEEFFAQIPSDPGMAFVVVTHQHPGHVSLLPELLKKRTSLRILPADNRMKVEPNTIYVVQGGENFSVLNGTLHRMDFEVSSGARLPIDYFFRALAEDQKDRAVCIILSGTGTDGTLGLKAIKGCSGMTMVQSVQSAKYVGMPKSAIMTDLVDYVLPVGEMPQKLVAYAKGPYLTSAQPPHLTHEHTPEGLEKILILLRSQTGHDFSNYKLGTVRRRIDRRMNVHQLENTKNYIRFLQENPNEIEALFRELLIGVTSFFRNPPGFDALAKMVVPYVLDSKSRGGSIRVWVAGCATGEEAYSIAIILQEVMESQKQRFAIQIFATDLDKQALESARTGLYPHGIAVDVTPERLGRRFTKRENGYQINKEIREMVIFAPHNLIVDAPFTKLDVLSCRNLLIYLDADLQQRLLPLFHYALNDKGLLFLGSSESLGGLGPFFTVRDKQWKLFEKKPIAPHLQREFLSKQLRGKSHTVPALPISKVEKEHSLAELAQKLLLDRHVPASVIVNDQGDIAYIHGRTGNFLEPAAGRPSTNLFEMAREGLRLELTSAIREAASRKSEVVHTGIEVESNGGTRLVNVIVKKITEPTGLRGLFAVTFVPISTEEFHPARKTKAGLRKLPNRQTRELVRELQHTKDKLQLSVEDVETSNEELKSTNEELQSTNEELQSANEELETSKEEMQSLNEELETVNAQLQMKVDDLCQTEDDMQNLLNSTDIATIFLTHDLNIKQFTPQAKKVINLLQSDVGRPITDLVSNLSYESLVDDAQEVLRTLLFKEEKVQARDGSWYLMRITPYRTTTNKIDGLVITFVDISKLQKAQLELAESQEMLNRIIQTANDGIISIDEDYRIVLFNGSAERMFHCSAASAIGQTLDRFISARFLPQFRERLQAFGLTEKIHGQADKKVEVWEFCADGKALSLQTSISQTLVAKMKLFTVILRKLEGFPLMMDAGPKED